MDKKTMRDQMLHMRKTLQPQFHEEAARITGGFLASLKVFQQAETVMLYCDFNNETGTDPLLTYCLKKKRTVLPFTDKNFRVTPYYVTDREQLAVSPMGIREPDPDICAPCAPGDIDLVVVPGVAFDVAGRRLGYGKGCYDRFLPLLRPDAPLIGLAYDFQVLPSIPAESHDLPMDAIITEKGLLNAPKAKNPVL